MEEDLESAQRYRERAKKLRIVAEGTKDKVARKTILGLADNYEQMAASRERINLAEETLKSVNRDRGD